MGTMRDLFVQTETFVLFLACITVKNRLPVPLPLERGVVIKTCLTKSPDTLVKIAPLFSYAVESPGS